MIRQPVVANSFYPGDPHQLQAVVSSCLTSNKKPAQKALAVISPHAGYIYSGKLAGKTLSSVTIPKTVVLLGPNHTGIGPQVSLSRSDWATPLNTVPCNNEFSERLLQNSEIITCDESAHSREHSLEVQLPFLQTLQPDLSIVPITISSISFLQCSIIAKAIAKAITQSSEDTLIVASNDMSHFLSREEARKVDTLAISKVLELTPEELYKTVIGNKISMCGVIPVTVALLACIELGAKKCSLIDYTDSGEISGDFGSVVGYAGLTIS